MDWKNTGSVKVAEVTKRDLDIPLSPTLHRVLSTLGSQGHKALIVGGAVRDAMVGEKPKDIDVEVYGTHYKDLAKTLSQHGKVNVVGQAFGVVKFRDPDNNEYDFSLPRRENKSGVGHKDFQTDFDPTITPKEAASRRDFTMNALAYDPVKGELHDYFGGEQDLKDKVLRHTSDAFAEDPLRVLRGMQFAARYGMHLHPDTAAECRRIAPEFHHLPKERVGEEFMKLATKGKHPGAAIDFLKESGWADNFPAVKNIVGLKQDSTWHPEGTVDIHTAHAMNASAKIADREGLQGDDRATLVLGAMAHDFGKATHTQVRADGRITSHGHDQAGGPIARQFLDDIGIKPDITRRVVPLVEQHMQHINFAEKGASSKAIRRLAQRVSPGTIKELGWIAESDHSGRPPLTPGMPKGAQRMLDAADRSKVTEGPMKRFVEGRDVMPYFNNEPGPHIGEHVKAAYEAQLNGDINSPEEAQDWLHKRLSTKISSWADVRNKAMRLRNADKVHIILLDDKVIAADVGGDHAIYHVVLYRQDPNSWAISFWECSCKWGDWAFKRQVTYVGRMCSHALATLYKAHSSEYKKSGYIERVARLSALKEHMPHTIDAEPELRKHMLKKHVTGDDDELKDAVKNLQGDDLHQFHDEDHDFFHQYGWEDSTKIPDFDDDDSYTSPSQKWKEPYKPKRAEEYVKDVEAGPKREGDDFDYDTRWFNDKSNTDVLDTVKSLTDSYPVTKKWFKGIQVSDNVGGPCVVPSTGKIWLPPHSLDKPGIGMPGIHRGKNTLIAHEFGHVLQASIVNDTVPKSEHEAVGMGRTVDDLNEALGTGVEKLDPDLSHPDSPATYLMNYAKERHPGEEVSGYAKTNQRECFAEMMRKHWTDPADSVDKQSRLVGHNIDFLYHKDGAGWNSRQEKTASSWYKRVIVDPERIVASTSRGSLMVRGRNGRDQRLSVEISEDAQSIRTGLMNRQFLPQDQGMVFLYPMPPSYSGFWMKNTLVPLSIAFWDKTGRIIEVLDMEPCLGGSNCPVYRCKQPYWGAVEVNKGWFARWGLGVGDRIELRK